MDTEKEYRFQRHKNPIISLCHFQINVVKMWRVKITPTLVILLGILIFLFGFLVYMAIEAEISRAQNLIEKIGNPILIIFFVPVVWFFLALITYCCFLKWSFIYKLSGIEISNQGINFKFKDNEKFFDYSSIKKLTYNPFGAVIGNFVPNFLVNLFADFRIFYNIEIKEANGEIKNIAIPFDIEKVDEAINIISSKLEKGKVDIGFSRGKPTTAYVPGITHAGIANEPIGKWILLFTAILILIIYFVTKFFL